MTRDIVEAAKAWVPEIKEAGADIVIALSHSGIDANKTDLMENASLFLGDIDGLDAIFTGHQHLVFPGGSSFDNLEGVDNKAGTLKGKPAVMGGFWGSHMGLIDLLIERDGNQWKVVSAMSEARPIYERKDGKNVRPGRGFRGDRRGAEGRPRGDAGLCPPSGGARPRHRFTAISPWLPTIPRCRS